MDPSSSLRDWLTWAFSPAISAILVTLLISILSPILFHYYLYRKSSSKQLPTFLLVGPSGGGKTSLLTSLTNSSYTSQTPTSTLCTLPSTTRTSADRYRSENDPHSHSHPSSDSDPSSSGPQFLLLDTPGHGKLRHHAFSTLLPPSSSSPQSSSSHSPAQPTNLQGIIFVVDSASLSSPQGLNITAEYLHDVLLALQKRQGRDKKRKAGSGDDIGVLIAANKQDVFSSLPVGMVEKRLEEEIGRVREGRSKGLLDSGVGGLDGGDAGGEDEEGEWLGEYGSKRFGFGQMGEYGVEVRVSGGSVKGEEGADVQAWWDWVGGRL